MVSKEIETLLRNTLHFFDSYIGVEKIEKYLKYKKKFVLENMGGYFF